MSYTISHCLPELDEPERLFIERLTTGMSETDIRQFAVAYRQGRKDPQLVLLMAVIGIVAVPGLPRFALGPVVIGFLYLPHLRRTAIWHNHRYRQAQRARFYLQSTSCTADRE